MTQVNRPDGIYEVNNSGPAGKASAKKPETIPATGSGQAGSSGVSAKVGQALIGFNHDNALEGALAKANKSPTRAGLSKLALSVIFGPQAADVLLPKRASDADRALLAGALTTPDYR